MGRRSSTKQHRSAHTLPSSPTHSSSSSDFEFTISISPRKSSSALCPADELFYKGQLLPLQLSPRLSMVRNLLLSSPSTSSSATTSARDSSGSSSDFSSVADCCDSSRPSSVTDQDDELKRLHSFAPLNNPRKTTNKYFSLPKLSAVFRKEPKGRDPSPVKRMSSTAKEVIRKYLKKVKPLYEKLSQKQQQQQQNQQKLGKMTSLSSKQTEIARSVTSASDAVVSTSCKGVRKESGGGVFPQSFSGNLKYTARNKRACVSSCPSSMRSSPSHSGVLTHGGFPGPTRPVYRATGTSAAAVLHSSLTSSMEELQSAIQGAIAHCKNSMLQQNKSNAPAIISNEI